MNSYIVASLMFVLFFFIALFKAHAADISLDLPTALQYALKENPELKATRHSLGTAQGRARQAGLLFQHNPRFSLEMESATAGRSDTSVEVNLLQELEIAGQRGYRSEAAAKNLAQAKASVEDAERLLRLEVTQVFYNLLALQQIITDLREVLAGQENLLQVGQKRFEREDISILEVNTLRIDRDQVRTELANKMRERVLIEKQLRLLTGLQEEGYLILTGNLLDILTKSNTVPNRETFYACVLANRPDLKALKLAVEARDAELRLAQARRLPNVSLGPRYKRDNSQNLFGGEIAVPLPFFNRNQEEIATAIANQNVSRAELEGRMLAVKQEVDSAYKRMDLATANLGGYGKAYLGEIEKNLALTRKAYESGEMTIFEFSAMRDRLTQSRFRFLDVALGHLQAVAELEAQAPSCFDTMRTNQSVP